MKDMKKEGDKIKGEDSGQGIFLLLLILPIKGFYWFLFYFFILLLSLLWYRKEA